MSVYRFPVQRAKVRRACTTCGTPMPERSPTHHHRCVQCYRHIEYARALFRLLDASKRLP